MQREKGYQMVGKLKGFHEKDRALRQQFRGLMKTLEEVNKRLKESESLKTNFLSNIRNEINNPLTSIMGLSKQINHGLNMDPYMLEKTAEMIYSEAFDLDFQLRNIFAAAELEAGEQILNVSKVDVNTLIRSTIDMFQHKLDKKKIKISYSFEAIHENGEIMLFKTDSEKLKLILSNLLSNAIEFNSYEGKIELEVKQDNDYLVFSLTDSGIGFDLKDQKKIFERFRQLDTGTRRKHCGHGLGLSITKDLIELFGGKISVASSKRKWSVFTVSIPEINSLEGIDAFSDDGNVFVF